MSALTFPGPYENSPSVPGLPLSFVSVLYDKGASIADPFLMFHCFSVLGSPFPWTPTSPRRLVPRSLVRSPILSYLKRDFCRKYLCNS